MACMFSGGNAPAVFRTEDGNEYPVSEWSLRQEVDYYGHNFGPSVPPFPRSYTLTGDLRAPVEIPLGATGKLTTTTHDGQTLTIDVPLFVGRTEFQAGPGGCLYIVHVSGSRQAPAVVPLTEAQPEPLTLDDLRALCGDIADVPPVRFNSEGGFRYEPSEN